MAVILLMGIPGSGKSTFADQLHDQCSHTNIKSTLIRFDDIGNALDWDENSFWRQRNENLKAIEDWIIQHNAPLQASTSPKPILIIDDIMYLRSMRRKIYVMTRNISLPLLVVWIKTTLETALIRNNLRTGRAKISIDTIMKINEALQPPDKSFIFDRNNIIIENDIIDTGNVIERTNSIENVINYTKTLIETASHIRHIHHTIALSSRGEYKDTGIIPPDREKESILKDIDLSMRELTSIAMKRLVPTLTKTTAKQIGTVFAQTKAETLHYIRRNIMLPDKEIASFKMNILKIYSECFITNIIRNVSSSGSSSISNNATSSSNSNCGSSSSNSNNTTSSSSNSGSSSSNSNNTTTTGSSTLQSDETEYFEQCVDYLYTYVADKYS